MASVTPFRSELSFASLVAYCPRGDTPAILASRQVMYLVKENRVTTTQAGVMPMAAYVALRAKQIAPAYADTFLSGNVALVPVPRSGLQKAGALWPAKEIAEALRAVGYGSHVLPCLSRTTAVPKAATAAPRERPKARVHYESLTVTRPLELPATVTLVDDVVTRGAQLLGAAWRIWAVRPDVVVRAFAVIRTISDPADFEGVAAPCVGTITLRGEDAFRSPLRAQAVPKPGLSMWPPRRSRSAALRLRR